MEESKLDTGEINSKKSRKSLRMSPMSWVRLIAILLIVLIAVGAFTGWIAITFKQPSGRVTVRTEVCGDDIIAKYNTATLNVSPADPTPSAVTDLVADISKRANYQSDPTCLYIEYTTLMQKNNYTEANNRYEKMVKLADGGSYTSTKVNNMSGLDSMKRNLEFIKPADPTAKDLREVGND